MEEFRSPDFDTVKQQLKNPVIFDGRNLYDPALVRSTGIDYQADWTSMRTLPDLSTARLLVVGDVMLDRYWFGDVSRISPEAPVPVVKVERSEERPAALPTSRATRIAGGNGIVAPWSATTRAATARAADGAGKRSYQPASRCRHQHHGQAAGDRASAAVAAHRLRNRTLARVLKAKLAEFESCFRNATSSSCPTMARAGSPTSRT